MTEDGRLTQLSPSLWWYRDTCNVYLWTAEERGLLVDFGSGGILDVLPETGVREIVAIAHTHHHRDQCGGDDLAVALDIPIWVPARELALFEATLKLGSFGLAHTPAATAAHHQMPRMELSRLIPTGQLRADLMYVHQIGQKL